VKLLSARGLCLDGIMDRLRGFQARLLLPGRAPVLSGVVQLQRSREHPDVTWDHEEQFTEVTTLSELVIEVWGLPLPRMFGASSSGRARRHGLAAAAGGAGSSSAATSSTSRDAGGRATSGGRPAAEGPVESGSSHGELPSNSIFLGAINVSLRLGEVPVRVWL
jgi:hypothetical protein